MHRSKIWAVVLIFSFLFLVNPFNSAKDVFGAGVISKVQSQTAIGATGNILATSFLSNTTSGNLIIVTAETDNGANISISDSQGNTYSLVKTVTWNYGLRRLSVFYAPNIVGGADTVTLTASAGGVNKQLHIFEYSGLATVSPLDQSAVSSAIGSGGLSITSPNITTTLDSELIFAAGGPSSSVGSITAGSGYTIEATTRPAGLSAIASEDMMVSSIGTYNASLSWSPGQSSAGIIIASFKGGATQPADIQPPTIPTNLVTTPISQSQINISWTTSTDNVGVTGYKVFRNGVQIATSTLTTYSDTGLTASTSYTYNISAFDAVGNVSLQSSSSVGTTQSPSIDSIPPSIPTNLSTLVVSSSQINLTWLASTDNVAVAGYKVFRNGTQVATSTLTTYSDTGLTPSTSYTYTVSAFDAVGNVSLQSLTSSTTTSTVSSGGTTAWTLLPGTAFISSMCPADGFGGSVLPNGLPYPYRSSGGAGSNTNCTGILYTWTGGVARTKAGSEEMWLLDGGGHADYGGNESYKLNLHISTPTFTRVGDPSTITANDFNNSTRKYSDNKPSSRHTYDQTTYVPWLDKLFLMSGAAYGLGLSYRDGWFYDPNIDPAVANPWTEVIPSTAAGCVNPQNGGYQPTQGGSAIANTNDHMIYYGYTGNWLFRLDPTTNCYTSLGQVWPNSEDGLKAIFDPIRNRMVMVGGSKVWTLAFTGSAAVNVTSSVSSGCSAVINSYGPGGFYDTVNDLYVLYPMTGGNTLYMINPSTWACTTRTTTGGPTANITQGMWGRFNYFPTLGKIAVMTQANPGWYTLDYGSQVTPPPADTQAPTTPTGLNATSTSSTQINLNWTASTDNVAVAGYKVFRNGIQIATSTLTTYSDTGLTPSTSYTYNISAFDAVGNVSGQSSSSIVTTLGNLLPDTTSPIISVGMTNGNGQAVIAGDTLLGNLLFTVNSVDPIISGSVNSGLQSVVVLLDGIVVASSTGSSISYPVNTRTLLNSTHNIVSTATDNAGNITTSQTYTLGEIGFSASIN